MNAKTEVFYNESFASFFRLIQCIEKELTYQVLV